jgi:hypothetical protein
MIAIYYTKNDIKKVVMDIQLFIDKCRIVLDIDFTATYQQMKIP